MNKRWTLVAVIASSSLFVLFAVVALLSFPIGKAGGVLPIRALCVTGIVTAALFLASGVFLLVRLARGLTGKGKRYYDNKIQGGKV